MGFTGIHGYIYYIYSKGLSTNSPFLIQSHILSTRVISELILSIGLSDKS